MYGPRSCEIARLLGGRPCWEVRRRLEQQGNQALGISATDLQASTVVTKGQEAEARWVRAGLFVPRKDQAVGC